MDALPSELLAFVFSRLTDFADLSNARAVNRHAHVVADTHTSRMRCSLDCRRVTGGQAVEDDRSWFRGGLYVENFASAYGSTVRFVSSKCKAVRVRGTSGETITALDSLGHIPNLSVLDLGNSTILAGAIRNPLSVPIFTGLTELTVGKISGTFLTGAKDAILKHLCSGDNLKHVTARECTSNQLYWIRGQYDNLLSLSLLDCQPALPIRNWQLPFTDLRFFTQLVRLDLSGCVMHDSWIAPLLSSLNTLEEIRLARCKALTDLSSQHLCLMPNLAVLSLSGCPQLTITSLRYLVMTPKLRTLDITKCDRIVPSVADGSIEAEGRTVDLQLLVSAPARRFELILAEGSRVFVKLGYDERAGSEDVGDDR